MNNDHGPVKRRSSFLGFFRTLRILFNLRSDTDEHNTVESIRANIDFKSANAWTLVFAIIIASVGLNTNSTAVIIGAMLISPLMGPILGVGLGLGINDFQLTRRAFRNLSFAVAISILASTLYFLISPLSEIQSELLARTRPTFFDVLIALFGGAAGIVALSRYEKSNAVPGVAIATALMPPLCTAGYGLANGQFQYFFGALYLFVINTVFICIATFIFVRYLKFQKLALADESHQKRIDRWVLTVAMIVVVPSLILAWLLQQENTFKMRANRFISNEIKFEQSFLVNRDIQYNWSRPYIKIDLVGESLSQDQIELLKEKMKVYKLDPSTLEIHQASLEQNIEKRINDRLNSQNDIDRQADLKLAALEADLQRYKRIENISKKITAELATLFPKMKRVLIVPQADGQKKDIFVLWKSKPSKTERVKISDFLTLRIDDAKEEVQHLLDI